MRRRANVKKAEAIRLTGQQLLCRRRIGDRLALRTAGGNRQMRDAFDAACEELHYAGACRRVGRCMRLAITCDGCWVGGIVLGSTFPNIRPRDAQLGLTQHVQGYRSRGLASAWASENRDYWDRLQMIVNHARTFVFPRFQGRGIAIAAHRKLLTQGVDLWTKKYGAKVHALDTLCTHAESRLFLENGWQLVGRTKGYSRDPQAIFSNRVYSEDWKHIKDNAGLKKLRGSTKWWIWTRILAPIC